MSYRIVNGKPYLVGQVPQSYTDSNENRKLKENNISFKEILKSYTLSNHASERIKNIELTEQDMMKLGEGMDLAMQKGSKNSLIVYKDIAFVTSIENRTVITAVEKDRAKDNIFTNVDSVVFL